MILGIAGIAGQVVGIEAGIFVGATTTTSASFAWPAETAEGDLAIISMGAGFGAGILNVTGGWAALHAGNKFFNTVQEWPSALFYKVLTAGDVSTPPTLSNHQTACVGVYRGPTVASNLAQPIDTSGTTLPYGGQTKQPGCQFVCAFMFDYTGADTAAPAGWTDNGYVTNTTAQNFGHIAASDYTNGDAITWTGFDGTFGQGGYLISLE